MANGEIHLEAREEIAGRVMSAWKQLRECERLLSWGETHLAAREEIAGRVMSAWKELRLLVWKEERGAPEETHVQVHSSLWARC